MYTIKYINDWSDAIVKVFISQPMGGISYEEIIKKREEAEQKIKLQFYNEKIEIISGISKNTKNISTISCLGEAIKAMADADIVCFIGNWRQHRGCLIEYEVARSYGLSIYLENDPRKDGKLFKREEVSLFDMRSQL